MMKVFYILSVLPSDGFPSGSAVKNLPAVPKMQVRSLGLGLGAQEPWAHAAGMPGWKQGQDSQTRNVAVKGMASLVCGPLGCEAQAGRECLGAPV